MPKSNAMTVSFPLRRIAGTPSPSYLDLSLTLPEDFSQVDVERIYRWLRTLPHEDPKPLTTMHDELTLAWSRNAGLGNALQAIGEACGINMPQGVREDTWTLAKQVIEVIASRDSGGVAARLRKLLGEAVDLAEEANRDPSDCSHSEPIAARLVDLRAVSREIP